MKYDSYYGRDACERVAPDDATVHCNNMFFGASSNLVTRNLVMTPFINIFNEFYAKDNSKKVKAVFRAKGNAGKPLCTNPPYGYLKDPEDKNHWIIDEEAAPVVCDIFKMCVARRGPSQISKELMRRRIPTSSEHYRALGIGTPAKEPEQPGFWQQRTVADILLKQEYLGHTVNFKTRKKSFKCKKKVWNDPSEWQIFENTHDAIIDQETFDIVQRIRDGRRRQTPMGEMPTLSGMLFCADCGAKLYQVRAGDGPTSRSTLYAPHTGKSKAAAPRIRFTMFRLKKSCFGSYGSLPLTHVSMKRISSN